jgi:hypothetical protein
MSNHFSAANLKHPGDDARLDLTDLFVFAAPDNPDRTVLIMDANPFTKGNGFHPDAVYRFNIDNDGDELADVAFSFTFSEPKDGRQTATAYHAAGSQAQTREPRGEVLIEAIEVDFDAWPRPSRPAHAGCSSANAATPSSPTLTVSCTGWSTVKRKLPVDRERHLRRRQHSLHRLGGTQRDAWPWADHRSMDHDQPAKRRHAGADGPGMEPVVQPDPQPRRHQRRVQRHRPGRRREEPPAAGELG